MWDLDTLTQAVWRNKKKRVTLGESQPHFPDLCIGANDLSLLPKDCLEVGLGSKWKCFSYFKSSRDVVPASQGWWWRMGTGDPYQFEVRVRGSEAEL